MIEKVYHQVLYYSQTILQSCIELGVCIIEKVIAYVVYIVF